jgi:nicotinamidase-related amidase
MGIAIMVDSLTTKNTLLLIIDLQERMMPVIREHEELVRRSEILIRGCRLLDVPIIVTQQYTKGLGETMPSVQEALGKFVPIEKVTFSCWGEKEFVKEITEAGRKNILVAGVEAHICVQQTVLHLLENSGHGSLFTEIQVMADCIGSRHELDYACAVERLRQAGAVITTMESALFELMYSAEHPRRKDVSALVR